MPKGSAFDPDAQAFITAAAITDNTQQNAINTLVLALKGYSIWTKFKAIYPIVGGTASSHKFNLKDPRDLDVAFRLTFATGWTHSATGMLPNGTTAFANSFVTNNTMSLTSTHLSIYSRTNIDNNRISIGNSVSQYCVIYPRNSGNMLYGINSTGFGSGAVPNSLGHFLATRTGSLACKGYKNGAVVITSSQVMVNDNTTIYIGAARRSTPIGYDNREYAFASIGDGLTDTEAANFYTAVQNFNTTLARQV
jgi:hypothetical protein